MTSIRVGTKVKVRDFGFAGKSMKGKIGKVTDIDYGPEFDRYTVHLLEPDQGCTVPNSQGGLLKSDLDVLPGDRIVGELICPDDIRVGDKIYSFGDPDLGVERPTIGVVSSIKEDPIKIGVGNVKNYVHLIFLTKEGGTIYSTWWGDTKNKVKLLEAAPEPHPVDDAKVGDSFTFSFRERDAYTPTYTKFNEDYWISVVEGSDKPPSVHSSRTAKVTFDHYKAKMN